MKKTLFLTLLCILSGAKAEQEETACGVPGALACDAGGRHVTACTRSGAWRGVRDCAASHEVCAGGRCVAGFSPALGPLFAAASSAACGEVGDRSCSSDCEYVHVCSATRNWVVIDKCGAGTLCVGGQCVSSSTTICRTSTTVLCGYSSKGMSFPNLEDCSSYLTCEEEWSAPKINFCKSGYYDPCSRNCSLANPISCNHYQPCVPENEGLDLAIFGNPSLHYTCAANSTVLKNCESGYYDHTQGVCLGNGIVCRHSC